MDSNDRIEFVIELARRMHQSGATAPRLEDAIAAVSRRLGLDTHLWSSPTAIIATVGPADGTPADTVTRVVRLEPGDIHLRRMCRIDTIVERVAGGELSAAAGRIELEQAMRPDSSRRQWLETVFGFLLASAGVAGLLKGSPVEMLAAGVLGLFLGVLAQAATGHPRLLANFDALAAFLVALATAFVAHALWPISPRLVLTAGLIVLLPGLSLTVAAVEVATQHLVSGSARFAGAVAVLLKLAFGALVGSKLAQGLGWTPQSVIELAQPVWLEWLSLLVAASAFALLFRARRRDLWVVYLAALTSYGCVSLATPALGPELGLFVAALVVSLLGNVYARALRRPGATFRTPGLILLVPGSVGFKSLYFVFEKDVFLGLDTAFSLLVLIAALVAGLVLGNSVVPPRKGM
jgi:uncharacterized membrane protein YjjP (DUF1212 family)